MMESHLNNVKVVIFDIGKTIFDKENQVQVSDVFIYTIKQIKEKGIKVGCCTMRPYNWCKEMIKVPLDFYICLNGSYVVLNGKTIINKRTNINNINTTNTILYGTKDCYYSNNKIVEGAKRNGFIINKKGIIKNPYVISLFNINYETAISYKDKYNIYYWPKTKTLNLQNKKTSNLIAIKHIMNCLEEKEFIYFGDAPNDLDIFKNNQYSFLVENGDPSLKKYAYKVCPSCLENGVAKTLKGIYLK